MWKDLQRELKVNTEYIIQGDENSISKMEWKNIINNKIYVYENESGDKGFIVTDSYDEAEKLHHEEYPRRRIIDRNEKIEALKREVERG